MTDVTADTSWLEPQAKPADDDAWLEITDPNAGQTSLPFRDLIDACMRGTNRVMAHNGKWLAYRPYNREFDKETNPRTIERMSMHQAAGWIKHIGTYDEVQIWEFLPVGINGEPNPYYHEGRSYVVGQSYWKDIREVAKLACERKWALYHDYLEGMATAIKGGRDPVFAKAVWGDALAHIAVTVKQIGGKAAPTEREINEGFVGVRRARGLVTRNATVMTLDSNGLEKVGF